MSVPHPFAGLCIVAALRASCWETLTTLLVGASDLTFASCSACLILYVPVNNLLPWPLAGQSGPGNPAISPEALAHLPQSRLLPLLMRRAESQPLIQLHLGCNVTGCVIGLCISNDRATSAAMLACMLNSCQILLLSPCCSACPPLKSLCETHCGLWHCLAPRVKQSPQGVEVETVNQRQQRQVFKGAFLAAADGAHSTIRCV